MHDPQDTDAMIRVQYEQTRADTIGCGWRRGGRRVDWPRWPSVVAKGGLHAQRDCGPYNMVPGAGPSRPQRADCMRSESLEEPFRSRSDSRDIVTTDEARSCTKSLLYLSGITGSRKQYKHQDTSHTIQIIETKPSEGRKENNTIIASQRDGP